MEFHRWQPRLIHITMDHDAKLQKQPAKEVTSALGTAIEMGPQSQGA